MSRLVQQLHRDGLVDATFERIFGDEPLARVERVRSAGAHATRL